MADPRPTLLIVDDHEGFRSFARALLEADGYVALGEAGDGETAVEAAERLRPDVVLLDIALPDIDGFTVCERLLEGSAPVVVLTSTREASAFRGRLSQSWARGFIAKRDLTGDELERLIGEPDPR